MRESLAKSRRALTAELAAAAFDSSDDEAWERSRGGAHPQRRRRPRHGRARRVGSRRAAARQISRARSSRRSSRCSASRRRSGARRASPSVILVVGVNGTGKTTTIGKLAREALRARPLGPRRRGRHVPRGRGGAARDLGRAGGRGLRRRAARRRPGGGRVRRGRGSACARPRRRHRRHGRPPAHAGEPDGRAREGAARDRRAGSTDAPHETLLVVDATTGQNGLQQARLFGDVGRRDRRRADEAGRISASGGVAIAIAVELGLPVKLVGVGEGVDDLRPFDAADYARALIAG